MHARRPRAFLCTDRAAALLTVLLIGTFALAGCAGGAGGDGGDGSPPASTTPTASPITATAAEAATSPGTSTAQPPDSASGKALAWFLQASAALPVSAADYESHLVPAFRKDVSLTQFNDLLTQVSPPGGLGLVSVEVSPEDDAGLVALCESALGQVKVRLHVDAKGVIDGLFLEPVAEAAPVAPLANWEAFDARLAAAAPRVSAYVGTLRNGGCEAVHQVDDETARPLGSIFKVYVAGAVLDRIAAGNLSWTTKLTVRETLKSLPSGDLQKAPDGTKISVREAMIKMISISDNTATDLLINAVGRAAVERQLTKMGNSVPDANIPFLTTRELFIIKGSPTLLKAWVSGDTGVRRTLLRRVGAMPLPALKDWSSPREIDGAEWFGSAADLCRAHAALQAVTEGSGQAAQMNEVMGSNDGGLGLGNGWRDVWFKGGSEPGVLTLSWSATGPDGVRRVVVLMASNPEQALNEEAVAGELVSLAKAAFELSAD